MGLLEKIKGLFTKENVPDDTRLLLSGVENVHELRKGLDDIVTRNEVELKEVEREIDKLEKIELAEKERVKSGTLTEREKYNTLLNIKRLRARMDSYQKRHKIHQENIDLHLALLDRIDEMEAMELKAVRQEQIDEIAVDYQERIEKHREVVAAGRAAEQDRLPFVDAAERRELEQLEKEILGEKKPAEDESQDELAVALPEKPATEKPATEKPVAEKPEKAVEKPAADKEKERPVRAPLRVEVKEEGEPAPKVNVAERRVETE